MYLIAAFVVIIFLAFFVRDVVYPMIINNYFKGEQFLELKGRVQQHIADCNDLNDHIEHLKLSYTGFESVDYGTATLSDTSRYNMNRREWGSKLKNRWTHQCSATVAKSANDQPYRYLCKYFNIPTNEKTLESLEKVLNDFSAVEQGKYLLSNEREAIVSSLSQSVPSFIFNSHKDRLIKELGFQNVSLSNLYFPVYTFKYVSPGGNSSFKTDIKLDIEKLEGLIRYLANLVSFKNSVAGQRALMTAKLREKIKDRDNYTCRICNLSTSDEPNLLLEIDHIIPLSKGGITSENNLQTLCWRCNRTKGSKIYSSENIPNPVSNLENVELAAAEIINKESMHWSARSSTTQNNSTKLDMTRPPRANKLAEGLNNVSSEENVVKGIEGKQKTTLTKLQVNALKSAKEYLEYSGYSREGLISQLHQTDSYTLNEATYGAEQTLY